MARFRGWVKIGLFLSSYIPLWLAMGIKTSEITHSIQGAELPFVSLGFLLLAITSGIVLKMALSVKKGREPNYKSIKSARPEKIC
jgi:hypothetical protein